MARSFGRSLEDALSDRAVLLDDISISGRQVVFYKPTSGQEMFLASAINGDHSNARRGSMVLQALQSLMDDDDGAFLSHAMLHGGLDVDELIELALTVFEEAGGRPTKSPSDYSPPQRPDGRRSTAGAPRKASTRSRSPRTDS